MGAGQDEPAGEVVIVQMRFGHVGDPDVGRRGGSLHPVCVALWIDDQGRLSVVDQVASVPGWRCSVGDGAARYSHQRLSSVFQRMSEVAERLRM